MENNPDADERVKEWNHDGDEWLGIYVSKKKAREAYDKAFAQYEEEQRRLYSA